MLTAHADPSPSVIDYTTLTSQLQWLDDPNPKNYCQGFYRVIPLTFTHKLPAPYVLKAKHGVEIQQNRTIIYHGASLLSNDRELTADKAISLMDPKTGQLTQIKAIGHVHLREPGLLLVAHRGTVKLPSQHLTISHLAYRIESMYTPAKAMTYREQMVYRTSGFIGRGTATHATQTHQHILTLNHASFSFCPPNDNAWELRGKHVRIDRNTQQVVLHNATFRIAGVPVLYTPYFSFSYHTSRKSGFLLPDVYANSSSGLGLGFPYYWNIAPNYGMFITPTFYTLRGLQLTSLFHYLTWNSLGKLYISFLPNDGKFKDFRANAINNTTFFDKSGFDRLRSNGSSRTFISWQNQTILNHYWSSSANINWVSDDYYFQDLPLPDDFEDNDTTITQLLQQASIQFHNQHWTMSTSVQNYETLHPVNTTSMIDQYAHTPQIDLGANYPSQWLGFDMGFNSEFVNFLHPLFPNRVVTSLGAMGQRYDVAPFISWPQRRSFGFFIPRITWESTFYQLHNRTMGQSNSVQRNLPIVDVDSGLYFDRSLHFGGRNYTQTLEPRLYYLYAPFRNQTNIPIFDAQEPLFTYNTIFRNNRFDGLDRIGDANQLGIGIASHFIDKQTGADKFDISLGQIAYFKNRDVFIGKEPNKNATENLSPLAAQLAYHFYHDWSLTGNLAWNYPRGFVQNGQVGVQYKPDATHIANIAYTYQPADTINPSNNNENNISQLTSSLRWPIYHHIAGLAALNFNLNRTTNHDAYVETYLLGLQYESCCWAVRLVGTRAFNHLDNNNQPVYDNILYIQFALKGLASLGLSSANTTLGKNIPGYSSGDLF